MREELYRVLCYFETVRTNLKLDNGHVLLGWARFLLACDDLIHHRLQRFFRRIRLHGLIRIEVRFIIII